jgi:hypothetical protein
VIEFSRYVFERLREDEEFVLNRGKAGGDQPPILLVALVSEHPVPGIQERLEHEYALREELDSDWAARPLTLARRDGRTMLVLEDPGGELEKHWPQYEVDGTLFRLGRRLFYHRA